MRFIPAFTSPAVLLSILILPATTSGFPLNSANFANLIKGYGAELFGEPSSTVGEMVAKYSRSSNGPNPEEMGEYYQGDILFPRSRGGTRNGMKAESARWEAAVIPYEIAPGFNSQDQDILNKAMDEYHKKTCIRFTRRTSADQDYVYITNDRTGCWSSVGRIGGRQQVNLQSPGCLSQVGTAVHELMHALGFFHEQNRYDRDDFVNINWGNIQNGKETNFDKVPKKETDTYGVIYDYGSVMHYSAKAFSKNGGDTITAKQNGGAMGQRKGLSPSDIKKLKSMYKCDGGKSNMSP